MAIECPSMDLREAEFFTEMSKVWWDKEGPFRIQLNYDSLVVPFIIEKIAISRSGQEGFSDHEPLNGLNILEIGCGGGIVTEAISKKGGNIVGIDINRNMIKVAKAHLMLDPTIKNVKYHLQPVEEHCVENFQKYDVVILNAVLPHIAEKEPFLKCCINCLKPGGSAFISAMSKTWASWLIGVHLVELLRMTPRGTCDWNKGITIEELGMILKKFNCKMLDSHGIFSNILTGRLFFIKNQSLAYIGHFIKEKDQLGN